MKNIFFVLGLLLFLTSCSTNVGDVNREGDGYKIVVIDQCEYIQVNDGLGNTRVYSLTHKGNCSNPIHKYNY